MLKTKEIREKHNKSINFWSNFWILAFFAVICSIFIPWVRNLDVGWLMGALFICLAFWSGANDNSAMKIYTVDEMTSFMPYYLKLHKEAKDYVIDEERQTIFIKYEDSTVKEFAIETIDNDTSELRYKDYVREREEKKKAELIISTMSLQGEEFDRFKELKTKEQSSLDAETFNLIKENIKVKENTKSKQTSKKIYI